MTTRGFTLIELMMVLVIMGVLGTLALPAYRDHVLRSKRVEAKVALNALAVAQERFFSVHHHYASRVASLGIAANLADLHENSGTTLSGYYRVQIEDVSGTLAHGGPYLLRASPTDKGGQLRDKCQQLTLDSSGKKGIASAVDGLQWSDCW